MQDDRGAEKLTPEHWLLKDLPSKGPPGWQPPDDPFPSLADLLFPDSRDKVIAWYERNVIRAIEELCDPVENTNRMKVEALRRGQKVSAIKAWLVPRLVVLWGEMGTIHDQFPVLSEDWVEAMRANGQRWAALRVPESLTGYFKQTKIPNSELPQLLRKFEELKEKAAPTKGKLTSLLKRFPGLRPELFEITGRWFPEKFAKAVLADEYECAVETIEKALTRARRSRK